MNTTNLNLVTTEVSASSSAAIEDPAKRKPKNLVTSWGNLKEHFLRVL